MTTFSRMLSHPRSGSAELCYPFLRRVRSYYVLLFLPLPIRPGDMSCCFRRLGLGMTGARFYVFQWDYIV
jgi:hypothetical protein